MKEKLLVAFIAAVIIGYVLDRQEPARWPTSPPVSTSPARFGR